MQVKFLFILLLSTFLSKATTAKECIPHEFPIKNGNYTKQEAYVYFQNSKRSNLYSYYYDAVINNNKTLRAQLYSYLHKTEKIPSNRVKLELLNKLGHKIKNQKQLCQLVNEVKDR